MKKTLLILGTVALIVFAGSAVWADLTIQFIEPASATNPVTVNFVGSILGELSNWNLLEFGIAQGFWGPGFPVGGFYALRLTEPTGGNVSDYWFLAITGGGTLRTFFISDQWQWPGGYAFPTPTGDITITTFAQASTIYDAYAAGGTASTAAETEDLQTVFQGVDNSGHHLTIQIQTFIPAVPLPPSVLLLGSGLLGLVGLRRFRKK